MRRSFGPGAGGPPMGSGGGGIIKTVHRALKAGIGVETYSQSGTTTARTANNRNQSAGKTVSLSSNNNQLQPFSYVNQLVPAEQPGWALSTSPEASGEEFDWECVDGDSVNGVYDDGAPSKDEVHHAVSSLQEALDPISFSQIIKNRRMYDSDNENLSPTSFYRSGSESDWMEPALHLFNSTRTLQFPDTNRVYDAFYLLQTEPSVKRMVISLSSDKAVWDAVMNNEVVRELRESINGDESISEVSDDRVNNSNPVSEVLGWIFVNTKIKMIEIVEKIVKIVNELVQPMTKEEKVKPEGGAPLGSFEGKLKSSFLLSVIVLLIVVVSRAHRAST